MSTNCPRKPETLVDENSVCNFETVAEFGSSQLPEQLPEAFVDAAVGL